MTVRLPGRHVAGDVRAAVRLTLAAAPGAATLYAVNAVIAGLLPVTSAWLMRLLLDELVAPGAWPAVVAPALGLIAAAAISGVSPSVGYTLGSRMDRRVAVLAMDRLYRAAGQLNGMRHIEDPSFRDRLRVAQQAGRGGPSQLVQQVVNVGRTTLTLSGFVVTMVLLDPWVALLVAGAGVPALAAQVRLSRARADMQRRMAPVERREAHYADLLVSVPAAKELRLLGLSELFRERMVRQMEASDEAYNRQDTRELLAGGLLALLGPLLSAWGLLWVIWLATHGRFSIGDVSVFVAGFAGLQSSIQGLVVLVSSFYRTALGFRRYREVEGIEPDLPVRARPRPVPALRRGIEVDDVWFRYGADKPWVLRGLSMTIPHGQAVALVGLNGAGKSTLIKLLCRFYDPERGAIRWDGTDLRDLDPAEFRERIAAVFQDYMEYDLSAAENIGVGDLAALADRPRVTAAARQAGVHDVLTALPRGYDTLLSRVFADEAAAADARTGVLLSGGQWQRVALARGLMRDKRDFMLLDEPSSGLDAESEHDIHEQLRRHRAGVTSLLVSHRLAAVRHADTIVVLGDGRVAERGTHDELLASGGRYARLFRLQAAGYAPATPTLAGQPR